METVGAIRLLAAVALVAAGCSSFAPPLRGTTYGAPGRLTEGQVELSGGAAGLAAEIAPVGGASLGIGLRDWLSLEAGASLQLFHGSSDNWSMGYAGPRFTFAPRRERTHLVGDLEFGVGAGAGGEGNDGRNYVSGPRCYCDGLSGWDRFAFGAYQGIGLGYAMQNATVFFRLRVEETTATNVRLTFWPTSFVGADIHLGTRVAMTFALGYGGFVTADGARAMTFIYDVGLTIFLDLWKRGYERQFRHDHPDSELFKP